MKDRTDYSPASSSCAPNEGNQKQLAGAKPHYDRNVGGRAPRSFKEFAAVCQKLERMSSSMAMVAALSAFLSKLSPDEAKAVAYLFAGEIAAPFEVAEFGMAERMIVRSLVQAYAVPEQRVEELLATTGDLGTVAQCMAGTQRGRFRGILQVFNQLEQIACVSCKGSQKEKSSRLARLLSEVSGLEAKYLVRTILGSHRICVADMTFLRALAKAYTGTTENKEIIENAYSVLPDLGEISRRVARSGLAGLRRIGPTPGTPVRMLLASRVQELEEVSTHMRGEMLVEYKYDGERVQVHVDGGGHVHAFSRRLERITEQYPDIVDAIKRSGVPRNTIIEGEVVAFDFDENHLLPFQALMRRRRKHDVLVYIKKVPTVLFAFDLLLVKMRSLLDQPLSQRRKLLQSYLKEKRRFDCPATS